MILTKLLFTSRRGQIFPGGKSVVRSCSGAKEQLGAAVLPAHLPAYFAHPLNSPIRRSFASPDASARLVTVDQ